MGLFFYDIIVTCIEVFNNVTIVFRMISDRYLSNGGR